MYTESESESEDVRKQERKVREYSGARSLQFHLLVGSALPFGCAFRVALGSRGNVCQKKKAHRADRERANGE